MSDTISVSVDVDVEFDTIAAQMVSDCKEDAMLDALARENTCIGKQSSDDDEKTFAVGAASRLHALAKWFRENAP